MIVIMRWLLALWYCLVAFGQQPHPENAPGQVDKPYVLLISLDGFRYDYAERYHAANLTEFGKKGVAAKALLPCFPTSTFPNHYTIATGLYPAHHGIVENSFWDPDLKKLFRFSDAAGASDPAWWGGTPLWVLAEKQGMRAASFFWPGSDDEIQHTRPTYYHPYSGNVTRREQIDEVIRWLELPKLQRPHFITLYFSDVDHESHAYGPDSQEVRNAVARVDTALGNLFKRIRGTGVPVNIFVVSDHGMTSVKGSVDLTSFADFTGVETVGASTEFKIYSQNPATIEKLYTQLKGKDPRFAVYRQSEIPIRLHYSGNDRIGDLVVMAEEPVVLHGPAGAGQRMRELPKGMHGYDRELFPEMRAVFYAQGPNLKAGTTIEEFENIHIFPLIAKILDLKMPPQIDGELSVLAPILK